MNFINNIKLLVNKIGRKNIFKNHKGFTKSFFLNIITKIGVNMESRQVDFLSFYIDKIKISEINPKNPLSLIVLCFATQNF